MAGRLSAASDLDTARRVIPLPREDREGERVAPRQISMQMRGIREQQATTRTTFWRGAYESDEALRAEFLAKCRTAVATVVANG